MDAARPWSCYFGQPLFRVAIVTVLLAGCTQTWGTAPRPIASPAKHASLPSDTARTRLAHDLQQVERELPKLAGDEQQRERYLQLSDERLAITIALAKLALAGHADADELIADAREIVAQSRLSEPALALAPDPEPEPGDADRGLAQIDAKAKPREEAGERFISKKGGGDAPPAAGDRTRGGHGGDGDGGVEAATVRADAPPTGVLAAIDQHLPELQACVPDGFEGLQFEVTTRLTEDGQLRGARFGGTAALPPEVAGCIADVLNDIRVPNSPGSRTITIPLWLGPE